MEYSPERRTALVLCGTGTHGAYHAGALRAFQETGLKIDVIAGRGVGAPTAMIAAIDGAATLWETQGLWQSARVRTFYRWRRSLRVAGWLALALVGIVLSPLAFVLVGLFVYPFGFMLELIGSAAGRSLVSGYSVWLQEAFAGAALPTVIPRAAMVVGCAIVVTLAVAVLFAEITAPARRQQRGGWWWGVLGAPLDARGAVSAFGDTVWQLIRGAAPAERPSAASTGTRYAEVLADSLGQPGVRELVMVATDLDGRQDVVAALLKEPYRRAFFAPRPDRERLSEAIDLAGPRADTTFDLVAAALTPAIGFEPHRIRFARDSFWRGEARRLCDRAGSLTRLFEELWAAGVEQLIVVSAGSVRIGPHRLPPADMLLPRRIGDAIVTDEVTGLRDAVAAWGSRFAGIFTITPGHNVIGPFDLTGTFDMLSDRHQRLDELIDRGYDDAYRQFIVPLVGASGDRLQVGDAHLRARHADDVVGGGRPGPRATSD